MKKNILFILLLIVNYNLLAQWVQINSSVTNSINDIKFINDSIGFCIGQDGIIKTSDYGNTWNLISASPTGSDIFFINTTIGFVISGSAIFKSTDSGATWNQVSTFGIETPNCLHFTSINIGYLTTSIYGPPGGSFIYKTVNGGNNWVQTNSYPSIPTLQAMTFVNADTGFVVGYSGQILKTYNAGASWSLSQIPSVETLISVNFPSQTVGYAAGYSSFTGSEIIKTIDGGNSWRQLLTGGQFNSALRTISFCSIDTGFAGGDGGRIITTVNGGVSWQNSFSPVIKDFYGSSFLNSNLGFLSGTDGTLLKTNNGGVTNIIGHIPFSGKIFPNPATNWITIESNNLANKKIILSLRNLIGQEITNEDIEFLGNYKLQFNDIESGVYFLSLTSDQEQIVQKIIVEK